MVDTDAFEDIPGTYLFNKDRCHEGYHLNMFCMSLMKAENREAFLADEFVQRLRAERRVAVSRPVFWRHAAFRRHRASSLRLARTRSSKAAESPRLRLAAAAAAWASERP